MFGFGEVLEDVHRVGSESEGEASASRWTQGGVTGPSLDEKETDKEMVSTSDVVVSGSADGFEVDVR